MRFNIVAVALLTAWTWTCVGPARAEPAFPGADEPYEYVVIEQDVADVLAEFGRRQGMLVNIAREVEGRTKGKLPTQTARAFLDALALQHNLVWYYDGQTLHVTPAGANQSRLLALDTMPYEELMAHLTSLGIADDRFKVRKAASGKVASVTGPPRFIALVEEAMKAVRQPDQPARRNATAAPVQLATTGRASGRLVIFRGSAREVMEIRRTP